MPERNKTLSDGTVQHFWCGFRPLTMVISNVWAKSLYGQWLGLTLLTALVYIAGIRISDLFVTTLTSARITPIWFPSAFTFSLFFYFGHRATLGIIIGSVLGLVYPLMNFEPPLLGWQFCFLEVMFTMANLVQAWLANLWLKTSLLKVENSQEEHSSSLPLMWKPVLDPLSSINPFLHIGTSLAFIKAALFAPMISALIGISSLILLQKVPWDQVIYSLVTWWLASSLAVIVFSPILIGFAPLPRKLSKRQLLRFVSIVGISFFVGLFSFWQAYPVAYLFIPLSLALVFYCGRFLASLLVVITAVCAIFLTSMEQGTFLVESPNSSIIFVQIFTGVLSATILLFAALIEEKKIANKNLVLVIDSLEAKVKERTLQLENNNDELEKLVNLDALTNIANRRDFEYRFELEWHRLSRTREPLTLMVLDIDDFKAYNDHYGHAQGDVCLHQVAQLLQSCLHRHPSDLVARYGGEEFTVLLPNIDTLGAIAVAERLLTKLRAMAIPHQFSTVEGIVTISIGIAVTIPRLNFSREAFFVGADQSLYRAKKEGKNKYQIISCD